VLPLFLNLAHIHSLNHRNLPLSFLVLLVLLYVSLVKLLDVVAVTYAPRLWASLALPKLAGSGLTWVCERNLRSLIVAEPVANRWHNDHDGGTEQANDDRVKEGGLFVRGPTHVPERLRPEERCRRHASGKVKGDCVVR
jgi:hypothetical protein